MECEWLTAQDANFETIGTLAVLSSHPCAAPQTGPSKTVGADRCVEPSHP